MRSVQLVLVSKREHSLPTDLSRWVRFSEYTAHHYYCILAFPGCIHTKTKNIVIDKVRNVLVVGEAFSI